MANTSARWGPAASSPPMISSAVAARPSGSSWPMRVCPSHPPSRASPTCPLRESRHSALPAPGSDEQLAKLAGRLFAQRLDRAKPLWEINLVEGLAGGRFALISKTHHALVDGVSGVDVVSVLLDADPEAKPPGDTE